MTALFRRAPGRDVPSLVRVGAALVLTLFLAAIVAPTPLARAEALSNGHLDVFYVTAPGGQLTLGLKEDITGQEVERTGDDVTLEVKEDAWTDATASVDGIGASTYFLPQTQDANLLWPGWDTLSVSQGGFSDVQLRFEEVAGPGQVYVFETGSLGGVTPVTSSGSLELASGETIEVPSPTHRHVNWAFTDPGTYTMTVTAEADGQSSNTVTYTWNVGEGAAVGESTGGDDGGAGAASASTEGYSERSRSAGTSERGGAQASGDSSEHCTPGMKLRIKDDTVNPPQWRDAEGATFYLSDAASVNLPEAIGPVAAGQAWMIGSTQVQGVPWLGANTQNPSMRENIPGEVTWELTGFNGPGEMIVYSQGNLGQIVGEEWFRAAGNSAEGAHAIPPNTHVHPNWVFSQAGTYEVTIRQSAVTGAGKDVAGQATLRFVVGGDEPAGAYDDGHFDLGADVDPNGGACTGGAAGSAGGNGANSTAGGHAAATGAARNQAAGSLANTGAGIMPYSIGFLGLGMAVLGLAIAHWALVRARA